MGKEDLLQFTNLDYVTETTIVQTSDLVAWIEKDQLPSELKMQVENDPSLLEDGKYNYYVRLHALDKQSYEKYATEVGADSAQLAASNVSEYEAGVMTYTSHLFHSISLSLISWKA